MRRGWLVAVLLLVAACSDDGADVTACEEGALRAAVAPVAAAGFRLDGVACEGGYAYARVVDTSAQADDADAVFRLDGEGGAELVVFGSSIGTAEEHGVPPAVWDEIVPAA